jgi:hypothetical protein
MVAGEIVDGTVLAACLVKPDSGPEAVMIIWPDEPTSVNPRHYGDCTCHATISQQQPGIGRDQGRQALTKHNRQSGATKITSPTGTSR